ENSIGDTGAKDLGTGIAQCNNITSLTLYLSQKVFRDWVNHKEEYLNLNGKKIKKSIGKGKTPKSIKYESKILDFINFNRKIFNPISTWSIIAKLIELDQTYKEKPLSSLQKWCYAFIKRNNLSFRSATKVGQQISKSLYFYNCEQFLKQIIRFQEKFNVPLAGIANMDESPIQFNLYPDKTVQQIGSKTVTIHTQGQEKQKVSLVLCILANGEKLPPFVIFKSKEGKTTEKKLKQLDLVKENNVFISCQQNAWNDELNMLKWIKHVWRFYTRIKLKKKRLLIMDKCSSHTTQAVTEQLEKLDTKVIYIPSGCTFSLQPLDVSINAPFKRALKEKYINFQYISHSFKITGISNLNNGLEDHLFNGYDHLLQDLNDIVDEEIKSDSDSYITTDQSIDN
ncbi:hypothetical protein ABPG72_020343, partial [Tetrahymena utriculariae]